MRDFIHLQLFDILGVNFHLWGLKRLFFILYFTVFLLLFYAFEAYIVFAILWYAQYPTYFFTFHILPQQAVTRLLKHRTSNRCVNTIYIISFQCITRGKTN